MNLARWKCLCRVFWLLLTLPVSHAAEWSHVGPLYDDFSLTLTPGRRTEAFGPFYYWQTNETQRTWGLPPFCWGLRDPAIELEKFELGYPLFSYHRFGQESRWQLIQVFSFAGGSDPQQRVEHRVTIFPIYFRQRSPDTNQNYDAWLPFYGHLKNRIFTDELFFVFFPLYCQARKADVVTDNYLFPLVSRSRGEGLRGWKVFPLAGHQHKDPTTRTNGFGEVESRPGYDRRFALMPFYLHQRAGLGSDNPTDEHAMLPAFSLVRSPQRDSTTVLWPLFTHVTDREKKYAEWQLPWPIVVFARGEGKTTSRVWPFFSQAHNATQESSFYLWPAYRKKRIHDETVDRSRTRYFFFLYSDTVQTNLATGQYRRRQDFFPFLSQTHDYNGNERRQCFAPVEPILPFSDSVEREYSPLWSVWRAEKNPTTGSTSQSAFWNLYRCDTTPTTKKVSLLFGLFQYQCQPAGTATRWGFLPAHRSAGAGPGPAPARGRATQ